MMHLVIVLFLFVALTAVFFYFSCMKKNSLSLYLRGGFLVFLLLDIVLCYAIWRGSRAVSELASYIDPYTVAEVSIWFPPTGEYKHWELRTHDPPEMVRKYYLDKNHRMGWCLKSLEGKNNPIVLILEKADLELFILISKEGEHSTIGYTLSKTKVEE